MRDLVTKMNDSARKTWNKVRESFHMEDTDEDYLQWKEEIIGIHQAEGDEGLEVICIMENIEPYDMEHLLYYAFE